MKTPLPSPNSNKASPGANTARSGSGNDTGTGPSSRSTEDTRASSARPLLQRSHPSPTLTSAQRQDTVIESPNEHPNRPSSANETNTGRNDRTSNTAAMSGRSGKSVVGGNSKSKAGGSEEADVAKLKEAMNAKLSLGQQRTRVSSLGRPNSPGSLGAKRVSPIKEESAISPSINAAFSSPFPTEAATTSTESTESARTIRGSGMGTPANMPLRTPSYPFPYVPGTPGAWSAAFHQPFTALSPTVTGIGARIQSTLTDNVTSEGSTPAGSTATFMPAGASFYGSENPQYPTPNLYELALLLNCEPGLDAWWATVTKIMHNMYRAERVTIAVPADPTDIENVPWGQKASFNLTGYESSSEGQSQDRFSVIESWVDGPDFSVRAPHTEVSSTINLHPPRSRPNLESRHSFAGHERNQRETLPIGPSGAGPALRPRGPLRTVSHAPTRVDQAPRSFTTVATEAAPQIRLRHTSLSDPDFSSVGEDIHTGPYAAVFPILRALDHEPDALIDTAGVNRILERGKLVTLTRDYSGRLPENASDVTVPAAPAESVDPMKSRRDPARPGPRAFQQGTGDIRSLSSYRSVFSGTNVPELRRKSTYEEYEQYPSSPWAQSPAPSPAIQTDPEDNPFFASGNVDEDCFNPTETGQDYSHAGVVEAIGVDRASTITHIPLVHPLLSQPMQSLRSDSSQTPLKGQRARGQQRPDPTRPSEQPDVERKAPIAIISILSPTVPYPQNLTQSLKLLGPHLATSFSNAQQYTSAHDQATSIRHRRNASNYNVGSESISTEPTYLDDLMPIDVDEIAGSISGSITSPSDYSGRSRHSPGGSLSGTPGWDPSNVGFSSKSVTGTPSQPTGTELVESYFDARKRTHQPKSIINLPTAQPMQHQAVLSSGGRSSPPLTHRPSLKMRGTSTVSAAANPSTPKSERRPKVHLSIRDEKSPLRNRQNRDHSPTRTPDAAFSRKEATRRVQQQPAEDVDRRHTVLHSYGADFSASFQSLPAAATIASHSSNAGQVHSRAGSLSDSIDMPPPSERLLRTIVDSLPVQIFTAAPDTGGLTWVNSKFLVYRGQDPRQVLKEPWQAIHPEDREEYMDTWNRSLRTGQQLQQKVRLLRFDGNYRWFYVRAAPLKDKRQNIVHWIGTNMDFHEQHVAELNSARQQETAASEAKYRALANSSPQIVFAVNRQKGVIFCNTQWVSYSGQTEAQALGLGFTDHVHPDDLVKCKLPDFDEDNQQPTNVPTTLPPEPRRTKSTSNSSSTGSSETERALSSPFQSSPITALPQAKLSQLASTGILKVSTDADGRASYSTEVRLRSKDGDYRWHLVRVLRAETVLEPSETEDETWYGTCTDINDHKALERDLKETMDEKSRFLSNMSHEIRTPLNGITGMVNFLIDSSLSPEQMEHVNIIRASTEGLRGLINDILDLSKAEAGMIQLSMDWLHVRSLIEEVNDLTSAMAIEKGLQLNYLVEENVPSMVKGDRFRIRQVLLNVIGNAIKFTQKGEVFVRCEVHNEVDIPLKGNEILLQFEVVDTGSGFTEEEAKFLFKRFSQIDDSSTRQHGGTGLGLVISKQLTQLHGGDMTAAGVPGKGSTFTFFIKTVLPSENDSPPLPPPATPGYASLPLTPATSFVAATPFSLQSQRGGAVVSSSNSALGSPRLGGELTQSPSPYVSSPELGRESPYMSSGSSDPSVRSVAQSSIRSDRSSASSFVPDASSFSSPDIELALPQASHINREDTSSSLSKGSSTSTDSEATVRPPASLSVRMLSPGGSLIAPMYSILVVCPLKYSREATIKHIEMTLPKNVPHKTTARESLSESLEMIGGEDPIIFTHIVLVLQEPEDIINFMEKVLYAAPHSATSLVVISDLNQKREIMKQAPEIDYEQLIKDRRLRFIFKPLKPSKFAVVFDPQKEREMSTDRNQDSAQQVAVSQKQVFEEMTKRLGNKGKRVLLVEDNRVNQMVLLKFLSKVAIDVETVLDGVQCTEKVFAKPHGFYSIILCDLHMPNKDGYQTCKDIRRWEKKNKYRYLPIIALSANVLGDVYAKCVAAGFNSYVTKPVDFRELSAVMTTFLDPADPSKPHEFMRPRRGQS
ncbi:hypothetical protein B0A49_00499 [Cryomyces minteri]|uniref:histidine kinase n=1 Tax=Cryomyces minteri TaxID=331657 RepID=A0A4V5NI04_9PEZI|nr:hypothetical protein B0A49_00499 [Cryomyces minteri]